MFNFRIECREEGHVTKLCIVYHVRFICVLLQALAEKELLIRHLEAIEADMLEREAGFEQMEKEKGLTEYTWQQKMMQVGVFCCLHISLSSHMRWHFA